MTNDAMTNAELEDLQAMGRDLAAAMQSPWEPACIARAFRTERHDEMHLTMQGWIDLEAPRSPLLAGGLPEDAAQLDDAIRAFKFYSFKAEELSPEAAVELAAQMRDAVRAAFATALPMREPDATAGSDAPDGFGRWLPIFACLAVQCGLGETAALAMRVDRAFALVAGHRRNQGWEAAGTSYVLRDLDSPITDHQSPITEKEDSRG
jgi:hypothetical protein